MFRKALLIALVFCTLVTANTVCQKFDSLGLGSLTNPDGTVNVVADELDTQMTIAKYHRNKINLEYNRERKLLNASVCEAKKQSPLLIQHLQPRQSGGGITSELFGAKIAIGTPRPPTARQVFAVLFDTGSSDLWVPSISCETPVCKGKTRFTEKDSLTFTPRPDKKFELIYGNGHKVLGPGATDTVQVGNMVVQNQLFSPVTTLSDEFSKVPFDGIIGLAFPGLSRLSGDPFFVSAIKQNQLKDLENKFAFLFSSKPGATLLTLGCVENTAYKGKIEKHLLAEEDSHWELGEADLSILQPIALLSGFKTVIDTGAYKITGPPAAVDFLYKQISGGKQYFSPDLEAGNHYTFPCASIPSISFRWNQDNYWSMSPDTVSLGPIKEDPSRCLGSIIGLDMTKDLGENTWILGEMFLRNVYTVFSMDDPSNKKPENRMKPYIGFAELK